MSAQTRRASAWIAGAVFSAVIVVAVTAIAQRGGQHSVQHVAAFDASTYQIRVDGGFLQSDATANRANALATSPGGCDGGFFRSMTASGVVTCAASASIDAAGLAPAFDANNFAPMSTTLDAAGFAKLGQDANFVTVTASHVAASTAAITNMTGTASTCSALAANPSGCSAGQALQDITAAGASETCIAPLLLTGGTMTGPVTFGDSAADLYTFTGKVSTTLPFSGAATGSVDTDFYSGSGNYMLYRSATNATDPVAFAVVNGGTGGVPATAVDSASVKQAVSIYTNSAWGPALYPRNYVVGQYPMFTAENYRGGSYSARAKLNSGDIIVAFQGAGSVGTAVGAYASIYFVTDGDTGAGDGPTRVVVKTTPDGSSTEAERLRITNSGAINAVSGGTYNACSVATADGDFCAEDALQAVGTLDVGGAATLSSTLAVAGNTTAGGAGDYTITINGASATDTIVHSATTGVFTFSDDISCDALTATGDVIRTDAKGATTKIVHATQTLTFAADPGDASKVTSGLIPAGATLKGISTRVVTAGTNCASIDIGDGTDVDRFGNDQEITDTATTSNSDATADPTGWLTTAREVTVTAVTANCFSLAIAVTAHYETISAATAD